MDSYTEHKEALEQEQKGMSKEDLIAKLKAEKDDYNPTKPKYEQVLDIDNLPGQEHRWIMRGAKATCENGAHAYHEFWFRRTP